MVAAPLTLPIFSVDADSNNTGDINIDDGTNTEHGGYGLRLNTGAGAVDLPALTSYRKAIQTVAITIDTDATEQTLFGTIGVGSLQFAANALTVGKTIKIRMGGIISEAGTPNLNFRVKLGATEIVSTGNINMSGAMSDNSWRLECDITVISIGASGTVFGTGIVFLDDTNTVNGLTNSSTPAAAIVIDTTGALTLNVTAQWDTASASNTITSQTAFVEIVV